MANLRHLRRHIEYVCGDIASECMLAAGYDDKLNADDLRAIITKIAVLQANTVNRLNIKFDKAPRDFENRHLYREAKRAYFHQAYKALLADFAKRIQEIVDEINALMKKA